MEFICLIEIRFEDADLYYESYLFVNQIKYGWEQKNAYLLSAWTCLTNCTEVHSLDFTLQNLVLWARSDIFGYALVDRIDFRWSKVISELKWAKVEVLAFGKANL